MPLDPGIVSLLEAFAPTTAKLVGKLLDRGSKLDSDTVMIIMIGVMNENTVKLTSLVERLEDRIELDSKKLDMLLER